MPKLDKKFTKKEIKTLILAIGVYISELSINDVDSESESFVRAYELHEYLIEQL